MTPHQSDPKKKLLDQLIKAVTHSAPLSERVTLDRFVRQFTATSSYEDLSKLPLERLASGLLEVWDFIQYRKPGEPKVKVYYWKPDFPTPLADRIVIHVINDDMPFLVDSLLELLHDYHLKSRRVIHPVLKMKRDDQGSLTHLFSYDQDEASDAVFESLIHCEIVDFITPDLVSEIQDRIEKVLDHVRLATQDWQAMRVQTDQVVQDIQRQGSALFQTGPETLDDIVHFLQWMKEEHFTYLGYGSFDLAVPVETTSPHFQCQQALGILQDQELQDLSTLFKGVTFNHETQAYLFNRYPLLVNKASFISRVHRGVALDAIVIKRLGSDGNVIGIHLFVGLFTSIAYDSSARDIPLLRRKVEAVLRCAGLSAHWHDGKALVHILDSLPRDDLFQASVAELTQIATAILNLQERQRLALFVRRDQFSRFLSCLVYVPRDRFDSDLCQRMGQILVQELKGRLSDYKAQFGSLVLARIHYILSFDDGIQQNIDSAAIEKKLEIVARSWLDDLRIMLHERYGDYQGPQLFRTYQNAFSKGYQEAFKGPEILEDIEALRALQTSEDLGARIYEPVEEASRADEASSAQAWVTDDLPKEDDLRLKIYHPKTTVPLSDILPLLENLDLRIIKENSYCVTPQEPSESFWVHDFRLQSRGKQKNTDWLKAAPRFLEAFYQVYKKQVEDDGFNRLVCRAGLSIRQCLVLRVYSKYLKQLQFPFSREYIEQTLLKYPHLTSQIVTLFQQKFDPDIATQNVPLGEKILESLGKVDNPDEDKILRRYVNLIQASVRTNYFQCQDDGTPKPYVSIKFDSSKIDEIPLPRPLYEVFVYSCRTEGVHLRGGKVARGGIRWSDRLEDFRTEILGLLKAQMVKNTVIVPTGSKGGFIVKVPLESLSREQVGSEALACYQEFMCGLLDLTDNLKQGNLVRPDRLVCWDEQDPYLVVAADKGTATFSDAANAVARSYGFWLDDAFASGGSAGYDHKKMGITARGAWESVKRHFRESDINMTKTPFRVVGVGDMGGDVFGNGMLLSRQIKLVAAFNHQHIFLDPNPDPDQSFEERVRLFQLPRSTWQDYAPSLISDGGGVFDRRSKNITLSQEAQQLLGLHTAEIMPNELIKKILTLNVDLLWFGGIGTFIKSSRESHSDVSDRSNDGVRVNAKELRCRIIGEGANLGVTQLGRIEFAQRNGSINTDAIDNSGGVDCSDHEVNIKILFRTLLDRQELSPENRDALLMEMTPQVAELVLQNNYAQAQALSLIQAQGISILNEQVRLVRALEAKHKLDRSLEFLPDDNMFSEMQVRQQGLTRPELAVVMAYAKNMYYEDVVKSSLVDDVTLEEDLISYFPTLIREKYQESILTHPLRREIIATVVTNDVVNRLGPSFLYDMVYKLGCSVDMAVKAYLIVRQAFDLPVLWARIESLDGRISPLHQMRLMMDILTIIRRIIPWLLRYYKMDEDIRTISEGLKIGNENFLEHLQECLDDQTKKTLEESIATYEHLNVGIDLAQKIAVLQLAASFPDIILIASRTQLPVQHIAQVYFESGARFALTPLRRRIERLKSDNPWQQSALNGLIEDLYALQSDFVESLVGACQNPREECPKALSLWITEHRDHAQRLDELIHEVLSLGTLDLSAAFVLLREYRLLFLKKKNM